MEDLLHDVDSIKDAHDRFFKMVFSEENNTRTFIKKFFPYDVRKNIDIESLKLIDNEKLSKEYKKYQLDLSFECNFKGNKSMLYIIFEHKSDLDRFVLLQILSYMVVTWETNLKQNKEMIPIIPIVFYHGKKKWNMSEDFLDQFKSTKSDKDLSFIKRYLPKFKYIVFDTNSISDEKIKKDLKENINLFFSIAAMKYAKSNFIEPLKNFFSLIYNILETNKNFSIEDIVSILNYIAINYGLERTKQIISEVGGDKEMIMTLTKKWMMEGEKIGRKEGEKIGRKEGEKIGKLLSAQEMVINAIEAKFDTVPEDIENKVKSISDRERLKKILKAMFKIKNIEELEDLL